MSILIKQPIVKPKIDLARVSTDVTIPPCDQVKVMSPDQFEQFITEWIYGYKQNKYYKVMHIGGAGDKGRDIIGYYDNKHVDYYQCKHYGSALTPSNYYLELGKLCYFTFIGEYPIPNKYYVMASNDIGPKLIDLFFDSDKLRSSLLSNWRKYCQMEITKTKDIPLNTNLTSYIQSFDFSIIETYPMAQVINEHLQTMYGNIRFGGVHIDNPNPLNVPTKYEADELKYIKELFDAYSEVLGRIIKNIDNLQGFATFLNNFQRQRKAYFSAETIRRFVRDTFSDSKEFNVLKEEVFDGIIDTCEKSFCNGFERLNAVMQQVVSVSTSKSLLDSKMKYIGNSEKKGVCHMLVNEDRIKWVNGDE
ncbi:MAG: restriction endonuclease [Actinobacteria bacterium]|nr:restriction endonuclease [Actinomycetota bacterium]